VACTLTENSTRHHRDQNIVESARNKHWALWWRATFSIRVQTTLNHIRFVKYTVPREKPLVTVVAMQNINPSSHRPHYVWKIWERSLVLTSTLIRHETKFLDSAFTAIATKLVVWLATELAVVDKSPDNVDRVNVSCIPCSPRTLKRAFSLTLILW